MHETIEQKREAAVGAREGLEQRREHVERSHNRAALTIAVLALLQIAIVLGSASIVVRKPLVLAAGIGLGAVAVLFLLNGYLLAVQLPF